MFVSNIMKAKMEKNTKTVQTKEEKCITKNKTEFEYQTQSFSVCESS